MKEIALFLAAKAAFRHYDYDSFIGCDSLVLLDRPYCGKGYSGAPIKPEPPKDKTTELKKRRDKRARRAKRGY